MAARALAVDPSLTLVSLRQLAEAFAKHAAARAGLIGDRRDVPTTQVDLLRLLKQRNIVRDKIAECFHMLRRVGNAAVHDFLGSRVATGDDGYQFHRDHRDPGTRPVARGRFFALAVAQ